MEMLSLSRVRLTTQPLKRVSPSSRVITLPTTGTGQFSPSS